MFDIDTSDYRLLWRVYVDDPEDILEFLSRAKLKYTYYPPVYDYPGRGIWSKHWFRVYIPQRYEVKEWMWEALIESIKSLEDNTD